MSVISIETRKANELVDISNISDSSIFMVHDGTGLKKTTFGQLKKDILRETSQQIEPLIANNAGSHNAIYRGKNIGTSVTTEQYQAISQGTFDDLYIGDYWTIGSVNYRIAAFDYYLWTGDVNCEKHHVVIVPDYNLYEHVMNDSNTTNGGYVGSKMYSQGLNSAKNTIKNAFSGHVLKHRIYLSNSISNGRVVGGIWCDSEVDLMNEQMVYGSTVFMPVSDGSTIPSNFRVDKSQLPLFQHEPSRINTRQTWWLRDVISNDRFAGVYHQGFTTADTSNTQVGVRPFFCIS
jgi:hypothetical protein|nr:MAG TPA: hypothetical protein [Caudoviricetes sp.]